MQTIGVNIVPGNFPQFVRYSQGDIGRRFKINVVDFDIPSGATVECVATKPSGLGFTVSGTVTDNTVSFITTAIMTDEWGKFPAELRISSGGEVLGTANFMFIGERNPHPEGTTDGQQGTIIPELTLLVNEIRESNARVAEMTASAHTSDVPTAEYDAETNNLEFGIPSIPEEEFLKAFVTDSASGSIASITDGADGLPIKSLNVNIAPKQSGSGDPSPSNVRPISGWDEVEVVREGVNVFDEVMELGSISDGTGENSSASDRLRTKNFIEVKSGVQYYSTIATRLLFYDANKTYMGLDKSISLNSASVFTVPNGASYVRFGLGSSYGTTYNHDISINYPSTDHDYHSYQGTSYPISLPSTVYGGEVSVIDGEGKSTMGMVDLGSLNWGYSSGDARFYTSGLDYKRPSSATEVANAICSQYAITKLGTLNDGAMCLYMNGYIYVKDSRYTSASDFKTAMNGVQLCYELATPTTVQLTPTEVTTLLGNNNIYADCGDVDVEYRADTKLYIDKLLGNTRTLSMAMAPAPETTEETEDDQR